MRGLGTIINALAIVIGGVLGILFKRFLKERYQDTIIKATGFSVVFLGAAGTLSKILTVRPDGTLSTGGSMVMILSLALVRCWVNLLIWMHSLNALASGLNTRLAVTATTSSSTASCRHP